MTILNGEYNIVNVQSSYYAVLPPPNADSEYIMFGIPGDEGGQWVVKSAGGNQYTIQSKSGQGYLGCSNHATPGSHLYQKSSEQLWRINESNIKGQYTCSPTDSQVFWALEDDDLDDPVTLTSASTNQRSRWIFQPVVSKPILSSIQAGEYNIVNVENNRCAVLPSSEFQEPITFGGQDDPGATWAVRPVGRDRYLIQNATYESYIGTQARVEIGNEIFGKKYRQLWIARLASKKNVAGPYNIWRVNGEECWGFTEEVGVVNTPVTLSESSDDPRNQWSFRLVTATPVGATDTVTDSGPPAADKPVGSPSLWTGPELLQAGESICCVAFSPDGSRLASGSTNRAVHLWDAQTGDQIGNPLTGHTNWVRSVAFSPDGSRLASASDDETVRLWNVQTGDQIGKPLTGHTKYVMSVAFSPDGSRLASASKDKTVRLWNVQTGDQIGNPLTGHTSYIYSVAFSPDGGRLASGSLDHTIRLWNVQTGGQIGNPLTGHTSLVRSVAFSPDGSRLASASEDQTVRLWNVQTGDQIGKPFTGHTKYVVSVAFSPHGNRLASASEDQTVRLWNVQTGDQIGKPFTGHTKDVWSVAFSSDGSHLASGSWDQTIRLWKV